jgi:hypothetical protein
LFFAEDTLDLWQNFRYFLGISFIIPKSFSKGGKIIDFISSELKLLGQKLNLAAARSNCLIQRKISSLESTSPPIELDSTK